MQIFDYLIRVVFYLKIYKMAVGIFQGSQMKKSLLYDKVYIRLGTRGGIVGP